MPTAATGKSVWSAGYLKEQLDGALLNPVRAFRPSYLPLLMVYFGAGALGITAVAESFWLKNQTTLSAADLAALGVWLTLPWTVKMVFGELVDTVPILGSQRRAWVYIGASLTALGFIILSAAASGRLVRLSPEAAYKLSSFLIAIGFVVQDVVADAMTTEVVDREHPDGTPRAPDDINRELGMVQVLGRLAFSIGAFIVAGIGGWLASVMSYGHVFMLGLAVPAISITGAMLVRIAPVETRPIDWRILGGGLVFGVFVVAMSWLDWPFNQEIVFVVSLVVVILMLRRVVDHLDANSKRIILYASIIIFMYRTSPTVGEGFNWFTIDVLGFDETFKGTLAQVGAGITLVVAWLFSDAMTRQPVARVLLWLTIVTTLLELPGLGLTMGLHEWTERHLGLGARSLAMVDSAITSPLYQLALIPLFTMCAIYAPRGRAASWFALMASLMSLSLMAGSLQTKYLNMIFEVPRGDYTNLPALFMTVLAIGVVVPVGTILLLGRRLR